MRGPLDPATLVLVGLALVLASVAYVSVPLMVALTHSGAALPPLVAYLAFPVVAARLVAIFYAE